MTPATQPTSTPLQQGTPSMLRRGVRTAAVALFVLNMAFLVVAVVTAALPREPLRERVRSGFESGALLQRDWLPFDTRRGVHQYDECLLLQMLTNERGDVLADALGPRNLTRDHSYSDYCATLHQLVVAGAPASDYTVFAYTRYWHGYMPVASGMLRWMSLDAARRVLHAASYLSCLLLLAVSLRQSGMARVTGAAMAGTALLFWGLPYYGQLFAHAPGDTAVILGVAVMVAAGGRLLPAHRLIPFAAAYGALIVYLEFLTGQLPTALAFLVAATGAAASSADARSAHVAALRTVMVAAAAFIAGAAVTVAAKQALAYAAFGGSAATAFTGSLSRYMSTAPVGETLPAVLRPFAELYGSGRVLTYGSSTAATVLYSAALLSWLAAAAAAAWHRDRRLLVEVGILALASAVVVAWVLALPTHTFFHARFMVRISMAPVALGFAAAFWAVSQLAVRRAGGRLP